MDLYPPYLPLTELIEELQKNGFNISTDTYLQLHQLLDAIDIEKVHEKLPKYLCSIFATNKEQQQKFKEIWDRLIESQKKNEKQQVPPIPSIKKISESAINSYIPGITVATGSWFFYIALTFGIIVVTGFLINILNKPDQVGTKGPGVIIPPSFDPSIYLYLISAVILLGFILYWVYSNFIVRFKISPNIGSKPPYTWNIRIQDQVISLDPEILIVAKSMQFRTPSGTEKIDLRKTIDVTCKNAGFLLLQYTKNTQPVEYLMLIDWQSERNHITQLFDYLYHTFRNNNVLIDRYYYDANPRNCWNELHKEGVTLDKLKQLYQDAYLLIFGDGSGFINHFNNSLYEFTYVFEKWEKRVLFSPVPLAHWGIQEVVLSDLFSILLPATTEGLVEFTEYFLKNSSRERNLRYWKSSKFLNNFYIDVNAINLKDHPDIPEHLRKWIAACAVYPRLYWDLTIAIGKNLESYGLVNLVTQKNLSILSRIEWFRKGKIPDEDRLLLLNFERLLSDNENIKNIALSTVINVLEQNLKEYRIELQNSFAEVDINMSINISKLMMSTISNKERKKLQIKLKKQIQTTDIYDFIAIVYINNTQILPTDFILPAKFDRDLQNLNIKLNNLEYSISNNEHKKNKGSTENIKESNSIGYEMVFVKGGEFIMGDNNSDEKDERPAHKVLVSDFNIGKYPVTQKQWVDVMGNNPSHFQEDENCPVEQVSWYDVQEFIRKLNVKSGLNYRLPTEAEWEYACRAGTTTPFNTGYNLSTLQANYNVNYPYNNKKVKLLLPFHSGGFNTSSGYKTNEVKLLPVGIFEGNDLGLYDMHGNVWEWCNDLYDPKYYTKSQPNNPKGAAKGTNRVIRGGCWQYNVKCCRSAYRFSLLPDERNIDLGFRLVLDP